MKKTIFLVILGVVTIGCIFYGTKKHFGSHVKFFDHGLVNIDYSDDNGDIRESLNQSLEKFSAIKMNISVAEVRLETGDDFKIESTYTKEWLKPDFSVKSGVLDVSQPGKRHETRWGNQNCKIIITVPEGTKLGDIRIDSNVGDITIRSLTADDITINLNVGEVDIRNAGFNSVDIDNNVGEITIDSEVDLNDYDISVSADIGEVRVGGKSYKRSYNSRGNGKKKIKVNTNVGEINIK